ncbi:hypothetical protein FKG96_09830 [Olivibacter sp. LS-1]|uniref:hypothetical protein n=1 Tax=Olivibacter sp. LS-1 TaxID=2592345 RepID=UPI0011EB5B5F|nr:hypothetical protein [Olivibacter sp. LS-1]QEL01092.1 hypothetical protein FKG96_09830 [Olivibacter sp. LS-1]
MEITRALFIKSLQEAAYMGAQLALTEAGLSKNFVSKNKAEKQYGKGTIKRMIEEGLINPVKDGYNTSTIRINVSELKAAAMVLNVG